MFHIFSKRISIITLLGSTLLLFGCSTNMPLHAPSGLQGSSDGSEQHETNDPDLQLVYTESETTLKQELEALSKTGRWDDRGTFLTNENNSGKTSPYNFPVVMNKQVAMYLDLFQNKQRKQFQEWLSRSGKYSSLMEGKLNQAGLPTDLIYLSMIESGYSQRAYSTASAVGLWQFMQATGKEYNLTIDKYVDERRDAEKSTTAAVTFLGDLYREFGDWYLAVAAYNGGPGKIRCGLKQYNVDNFWDLAQHDYLALETKRYVPKLIASIIIARQPEKFGFNNVKYEKSLAYDTVSVGPGMSLDAVSIIAGTDTATIKELNQELRLGKTPGNKSKYAVKIPSGSKQLANRNIDHLHSYVSTGYKTHTIRKGETLAAICKKYDVNTTTMLKVNNLRSARLKTGTNLRIPYSTVKYQLLPEGNAQQLASYKDDLILHRIKKGETISTISKKYCVPTEMIMSWNGLKSANKIKAGQQLALFIEDAGKTKSSHNTASQIVASTTKLVHSSTGSPESSTANSAIPTIKARGKSMATSNTEKTEEYNWYNVQSGDSLWGISRKFNISAQQIKEWNNLSSDSLQPGNRLKMKKV